MEKASINSALIDDDLINNEIKAVTDHLKQIDRLIKDELMVHDNTIPSEEKFKLEIAAEF